MRRRVKAIALNAGDAPFTVERGARIAQAVLAPVTRARWHEVTALDSTVRDAGGFGSTGVGGAAAGGTRRIGMSAPYRVLAYNTARDSENKIHDDTIARRFGFTGGLVPGVDVYAYMAHAPVARWGRAWLERGRAECRFFKPVYDGEEAIVEATPEGDGLALIVRSRDETCATGSASLASAAGSPPEFATPPAPPANRPPADERSLAVGTLLSMRPMVLTAEYAAQYLANVRESDSLYAQEGIAHPGLVLRTCNWALSHNVVLGPWIHVGSTVDNIGQARVDDELTVRARVSANYERKGHRFVELDVLVLASGRPVAHVGHVAIYRPRQVAA